MLKFINILGTLAVAGLIAYMPANAAGPTTHDQKLALVLQLGGLAEFDANREAPDAALDHLIFRLADQQSMATLPVQVASN